jgi:hypothetical protein
MIFARTDDLDGGGFTRVRYILQYPGYSFEIQATRAGVIITGTTPPYTDWVPVQEKLSWAQYQAQKLRETGRAIPQNILDQGTVA